MEVFYQLSYPGAQPEIGFVMRISGLPRMEVTGDPAGPADYPRLGSDPGGFWATKCHAVAKIPGADPALPSALSGQRTHRDRPDRGHLEERCRPLDNVVSRLMMKRLLGGPIPPDGALADDAAEG